MKKVLFCSFANKNNLPIVISFLLSCVAPINNNMFIFDNLDNTREYILTYNCYVDKIESIPNVICVHRKTESNTFYTINALNQLIKLVNNNVLDKNYVIDWPLYQDTLLTTKNSDLIKTKIKFKEIIKV